MFVLALFFSNGVVDADNGHEQVDWNDTPHHDERHVEEAKILITVLYRPYFGPVDEEVHVPGPTFKSRNFKQGHHCNPEIVEIQIVGPPTLPLCQTLLIEDPGRNRLAYAEVQGSFFKGDC